MAKEKFKEKYKKMNAEQLEAERVTQVANLFEDGMEAVKKLDYIKELQAKKK